MLKLNLGSGRFPLKGYKNIDIDPSVKPDECYDIRTGLREEDNSVDEILISHTLMYLNGVRVLILLKECLRVLKNSSRIRITEDCRHVKIRNKEQQKQYGDGRLFDHLEMKEILRLVGFTIIEDSEPFKDTFHLKLKPNYPLATGRASVYFIRAYKVKEGKVPIIYLGLDDFKEYDNQLDILWRLRHYFDDFRVNLFASPYYNLRESWLHYINSLDWICLCVHGYNHLVDEDIDEKTLGTLTSYERIYKAPAWELPEQMEARLKKLGFKIITFNMMNWEIDKPLPKDEKIIHAYGHIYPKDYLSVNGNRGSNLFWNYENIMKLPAGTEFRLYE